MGSIGDRGRRSTSGSQAGHGCAGEDVAASATDALAARHPESVEGLFATHSYFPPNAEREGLTPVETEFFEWLDGVWEHALADFHKLAEQAVAGDTTGTDHPDHHPAKEQP